MELNIILLALMVCGLTFIGSTLVCIAGVLKGLVNSEERLEQCFKSEQRQAEQLCEIEDFKRQGIDRVYDTTKPGFPIILPDWEFNPLMTPTLLRVTSNLIKGYHGVTGDSFPSYKAVILKRNKVECPPVDFQFRIDHYFEEVGPANLVNLSASAPTFTEGLFVMGYQLTRNDELPLFVTTSIEGLESC